MYQTKQACRLIAVLCGKFAERRREVKRGHLSLFPELVSSGRLEVHTLVNPTMDSFRNAQKSLEPNILYFQGEQLENEEEIGTLFWGGIDVSEAETFSSLMTPPSPTIVYLEVPYGEKIAQALQAKGTPYVIYWKNAFSSYEASHFRQALLSVVQSSCSHAWDAFQLAHASFRLYCVRNNYVMPANRQKDNGELGPHLLGSAPRINILIPDRVQEDGEEILSDALPVTKIYDDDVDMRLLVCGVPCTVDACLAGSLEDGLNALLNIEIRGSKLHNRISAAPPPLQAGSLSRGVVTMRCDLTTCSSTHISVLVSGSAQTCFNDQLLESHIKSELIEKRQLVHVLPDCDKNKPSLFEPLPSVSIACGASSFEVRMKVPSWAAQEEFLEDVMQFLILRGHSRLVPQGGISEFPDAILNAKRLDLFNLYREVVSRGGFYVGNGINWKGQVFSKMRNYTVSNRMTGVGNTLKRHYETYLLEYELAHDDVDGECCLLCHSSTPGDWVNCGLCGEWAHFGCDRRQGLATFKDYAKTDGLEYICPNCSLSNSKRKSQKVANGLCNAMTLPGHE
ncbi:AT-rich interactive domain-containing protein 4-like isoform X3 [Musa acuminata AAA Group]|uniref:AT-rich interactive domain-containing protein 4-like isoform X3 n=1 Tax=Musa acuminata AAA Group TaxID=214697 RepID=UPI0031D0DA00